MERERERDGERERYGENERQTVTRDSGRNTIQEEETHNFPSFKWSCSMVFVKIPIIGIQNFKFT